MTRQMLARESVSARAMLVLQNLDLILANVIAADESAEARTLQSMMLHPGRTLVLLYVKFASDDLTVIALAPTWSCNDVRLLRKLVRGLRFDLESRTDSERHRDPIRKIRLLLGT